MKLQSFSQVSYSVEPRSVWLTLSVCNSFGEIRQPDLCCSRYCTKGGDGGVD